MFSSGGLLLRPNYFYRVCSFSTPLETSFNHSLVLLFMVRVTYIWTRNI